MAPTTRAASKATSSRSSPEKTSPPLEKTSPPPEIIINWLFFNKTANPKSRVHPLSVPGHPPTSLGLLNWIDALEKRFRFRADELSLDFYIVSLPPSFSSLDA